MPDIPETVLKPCVICGEPKSRHDGSERFCRMYATYREPKERTPSSATPEVSELVDKTYMIAAYTDIQLSASNRQVLRDTATALETLDARVKVLEGALKPFAEIADDIASIEEQVGDLPSPDHMLRLVPMGHLRKARAALLKQLSGEGE